jgi:hypothetical protein
LEEGRDRLQHDSDLRPGGAEAIVRDVVRQTMDLLARKPRHPPWGGYLAVDLTDWAVVGSCGFKDGPTLGR